MTTIIEPEASEAAALPAGRVGWRAMVRNPLGLAALLVIIVITLLVIAAPLIAPYDPIAQDLAHVLQGPSTEHWLGTDSLGRDTLSRLLYGGQPALVGVFFALITFAISGIIFGILAGYFGGWVDRVISSVVDILLSLPGIMIILSILAVFSQNVIAALAVFGLLVSGNFIRVVRAAVISQREELYVASARLSGLSSARVMTRHILPGLVGPVTVQLALFAGGALALQTGLGFLGLADLPPQPSWGGMVGEAASVLQKQPYFLLITGGTITLMTLAFALLGDAIRDVVADSRSASSGRSIKPGKISKDLGSASTHLLEVRDYTVSFVSAGGSRSVVKNISFSLDRGEVVGLVGESGSGKTVTARSLLGLLPENGAVTAGGAWLDGTALSGLGNDGFRGIRGRRIGLVSQEPMVALDPMFRIGTQLIEVISYVSDISRDKRSEYAIELLDAVGIRHAEQTMKKFPHELSGGMLQRVAIAMALAGEPELLIADEPTTALDVTVQAGILDLLRSLKESRGLTVLLVTHDLAVVADVCDRAIVMSQGTIVEQGTVDDIFYNSKSDYTKELIRCTPSLVALS